MKDKAIPFPESGIVVRVKAERRNKGKTYAEYLTARQKFMLKKSNQVSVNNRANRQ